jgi:AcrR family transcriptional regulator
MSPTHQKTIVRKLQIINAARKIIIKRGSEHVTVRALAEAVGLTEGALYRHFKSKNDILSFLVDDIEETLLSDMNATIGENLSPLGLLNKILARQLSLVEQRRGMSFQVIAEIVSLGDKKLNKKAFDTITRYEERIEELLLEGIRVGEIKEDIDSASAAMLFFSTIQGLVNIWALSNYSFNLQERYKPIWNLFYDSVAKRPQENLDSKE